MKKVLFSIAAAFCAGIAFAQEDVSESRWKTQEILIDGNDNDWAQPLNFFDNTSGMIFSMANDTKNIYLCFSNNDHAKAARMMMAGWSVELVSSEKKRKFDVTIAFPKVEDLNLLRDEASKAVSIYKTEMTTPKAKGLLSHSTEIPLTNNDGVTIGIGANTADRIVYEIRIPVKELMDEGMLQLNEVVSVDVVVNALDRPSGQNAGSGESGGRSGFSGGGRGGGRMGGGGRGMRGGGAFGNSGGSARGTAFEKTSFKQKVRLVSK
ncbi:MAG: hypothetical protein JO301_05290 [Chitinophagaceae bacterium]|nr:hypothetical protein [Chitinophagaceae bacterium]